MKKNKLMRLVSLLLVCVLMTAGVISGTFAKYVTSSSASDTARVAKFGVTVTADGSLYGEDYVAVADGNTPGTANLTVSSSSNDHLVAPGTRSAADGLSFALSGSPEVMVQVDFAVADTLEDVFLAAGNDLPDMTTGDASDTFENAEDYYPVKYTLTQTTSGEAGSTITLVDGGKLEDVADALEELSAIYEANTDLSAAVGTLKLTWQWDFDDSGNGTYDKQDTLLGDLAAGMELSSDGALIDGTDYNLTSGIEISVTVTQVD